MKMGLNATKIQQNWLKDIKTDKDGQKRGGRAYGS